MGAVGAAWGSLWLLAHWLAWTEAAHRPLVGYPSSWRVARGHAKLWNVQPEKVLAFGGYFLEGMVALGVLSIGHSLIASKVMYFHIPADFPEPTDSCMLSTGGLDDLF